MGWRSSISSFLYRVGGMIDGSEAVPDPLMKGGEIGESEIVAVRKRMVIGWGKEDRSPYPPYDVIVRKVMEREDIAGELGRLILKRHLAQLQIRKGERGNLNAELILYVWMRKGRRKRK